MKRLFDDPIGKLDKVLDYLDNDKDVPESYSQISEGTGISDMKELELILKKLKKDRCVDFKLSTDGKKLFHITFEGAILNSQNGYSQKILDQDAEKIRVDKLASDQKANQTNMERLTFVLAFGSIALLIFEIYKFLFEYSPIFVCP